MPEKKLVLKIKCDSCGTERKLDINGNGLHVSGTDFVSVPNYWCAKCKLWCLVNYVEEERGNETLFVG